MTSPRGEAWNPPRDFGAERFVLRSKTFPEGRLFVDQLELPEQRDVSERQALTEDREHHRYITGTLDQLADYLTKA